MLVPNCDSFHIIPNFAELIGMNVIGRIFARLESTSPSPAPPPCETINSVVCRVLNSLNTFLTSASNSNNFVALFD